MNKLNILSSVFLFGAQDRLLRILKYGKLSTFQTVFVKNLNENRVKNKFKISDKNYSVTKLYKKLDSNGVS